MVAADEAMDVAIERLFAMEAAPGVPKAVRRPGESAAAFAKRLATNARARMWYHRKQAAIAAGMRSAPAPRLLLTPTERRRRKAARDKARHARNKRAWRLARGEAVSEEEVKEVDVCVHEWFATLCTADEGAPLGATDLLLRCDEVLCE